MLSIDELVKKACSLGASDMHIVCGIPVKCRVRGDIEDLTDDVTTAQECVDYARYLAGDDYKLIDSIGELDMAKSLNGNVRTRINIFRQQGAVSIAVRILSDRIMTPAELGLPMVVQGLSKYRTGLVLVTGETGSGKSTTLAGLIDQVNHTRKGHIVTLEDPIEYVYTPDKCIVNQREIGTDTRSYMDGLRSILREDPDIILIGEMRDLDTIESALTAAETGHLVFSTLHTNSAADTVDRIVGVFPDIQQRQIRMQLSTTLRAVVSQQLVPTKNGSGRVAACEVMIVNSAIQNLIREGKSNQIDSFIGLGSQEGSISMDNALQALVRNGQISREDALSYARYPERFSKF